MQLSRRAVATLAGALLCLAPAAALACTSLGNTDIVVNGSTTDWGTAASAGKCEWQTSSTASSTANGGDSIKGLAYTHSLDNTQQWFVLTMWGALQAGATYTMVYTPPTVTANSPAVTFTITCTAGNRPACGTTATACSVTTNPTVPNLISSINIASGIIEMGGLPVPTQQMPLYENSTITARVTPTASCNTTSNSLTLNGVYPDKYTGATAATVRSFEAYATGHGVELRWETGAETGTLGFILHRDSPTGPRVNRELVHGLLTSPIGRGYAFQDPAGNGSTRYFLEEVATEGRHLFGPAKNLAATPGPLVPRAGLRVRPALEPQLLSIRQPATPQAFSRITQAGIYALDDAAITSVGLQPGMVQVGHDGQSVPTFTLPDGRRAFYGAEPTAPSRRDDAYQLDPGLTSTSPAIRGAPALTSPVRSFPSVVHVEQHAIFDPSAPAALRFPWTDVFTGGGPTSVTFDAPGYLAAPSTLSVDLIGLSDFEAALDHHVTLSINGVAMADARFGGTGEQAFSATLPAGALVASGNVLTLEIVDDLGVPFDIVGLSSVDVQYTRAFVADHDRLEFSAAANAEVLVSGFSASPVVLDVTDPAQPELVGGAQVQSVNGAYSVRFHERLTSGTRRYLAAIPQSAPVVASRASEVPAGGGQWVAIVGDGLEASLQPLANFRASQGLSTRVVPVQAIYDRFGHGEHGVEAIEAYLQQLQPAPTYVLLVGKPSVDPHDYLGTGTPDLVPTELVTTRDFNTVAAFDGALVAGSDGRTPSSAIGRIPVSTAAELDAYVHKLIGFEKSGRPSGKALFAADWQNPTTGEPDPFFHDESVALEGRVGALAPLEVFMPQQGNAELMAALQQQPDLVTYHGHADGLDWSSQGLLGPLDVPNLPHVRPFFLVTVDCWDGMFAMPSFDALAQLLVEAPAGGAIAAFSASSLVDEANDPTFDATFPLLADPSAPTIGAMTRAAQTQLAAVTGQADQLVRVYNLIGDPATKNPLH